MDATTKFMSVLDADYRKETGLSARSDYSIFYSRIRPSEVLVIGYNPGGNPETWDESQLASRAFYENDEHEYVDCHYPLATAMRSFLIQSFSLPNEGRIRQIPKINLIFRRSRSQDHMGSNEKSYLSEAKPFVERILARVAPRLIIVEGTTTLSEFGRMYCSAVSSDSRQLEITTPNGRHPARLFKAAQAVLNVTKNPIQLIAIGHPSKYSRRPQWTQVIDRARALIQEMGIAI